MSVSRAAAGWVVGAGAGLAFLIALLSPVQMVDSDPAMALLASQALLDHGTLSLDVYRDHPDCAYDFDGNYRVKRLWGSSYYFSLGPPIVSTPAVWVANQLGFHMLRQEDEFATQNVLSALACALVFILLYRLSRYYVDALPGLVIATVSTFGSSLMSTLATGLWNTDLALVWICLALVHLAGRRSRPPAYGYLSLLVALAFLCRPSSAIFAVAIVASRVERTRRTALGLAIVLLLALGIWLVAGLSCVPDWLPSYYVRRKLVPDSFFTAAHALLLSPSRGLYVFSPFLLPVVGAAVAGFSGLWRSRMFRLAVIWVLLLVTALSLKSMWWGGHSYGSRPTTELMPAFVLVAALLWQGWTRHGHSRAARIATISYLLLALPAIAIHSGQGLFNPAVRRWNEEPTINLHPRSVFDWRFPQFLATDWQIETRRLVLEPPTLLPYRLGETIPHDAEGVVFVGWYEQERDLRWTRGRRAELLLWIDRLDAARPHLLEIQAGALGQQRIEVSINDEPVGAIELDGLAPREVVLLAAPGLLLPGENRIQLTVHHPKSTDTDSRKLGLALRELRFELLVDVLPTVGFRDEGYLTKGFSDAEEGWRWTAARRAVITYPVGEVDTGVAHTLRLTAGALGRQSAVVWLNGHRLGELAIDGFEPVSQALPVPAGLLRPFRLQRIDIEIPGATSTDTDTRLLGVAFVTLRLEEGVSQPAPTEEPSP